VRQFFGLYRGTVVLSEDPEGRNRVKVRVPGVYGTGVADDDLPWAMVLDRALGQNTGEHPIPHVGVSVAVEFIQGHPDEPVVVGQWLTVGNQRNTSRRSYVLGDLLSVVEGEVISFSVGSTRVEAQGDLTEVAQGRSTRSARSVEDRSTGPRMVVVEGRETKSVEGDSEAVYGGAREVRMEGGLSTGVVGDVSVGVAGRLDVLLVTALSSFVRSFGGSLSLQFGTPAGPLFQVSVGPDGVDLGAVAVPRSGVATQFSLAGPLTALDTVLAAIPPSPPEPLATAVLVALRVWIASMQSVSSYSVVTRST